MLTRTPRVALRVRECRSITGTNVAELAAGRLILPFELQVPLQSAYYLVCAEGAELRTSVAAFRDWLLAEAAQQEKF